MKFSSEWKLEMNWSVASAVLVPPGGDRRHAVHLYKLFAEDQSFKKLAVVPWCEAVDSDCGEDDHEGDGEDGNGKEDEEDNETGGIASKGGKHRKGSGGTSASSATAPPKAPVSKAPMPKAPSAGTGLLARARVSAKSD